MYDFHTWKIKTKTIHDFHNVFNPRTEPEIVATWSGRIDRERRRKLIIHMRSRQIHRLCIRLFFCAKSSSWLLSIVGFANDIHLLRVRERWNVMVHSHRFLVFNFRAQQHFIVRDIFWQTRHVSLKKKWDIELCMSLITVVARTRHGLNTFSTLFHFFSLLVVPTRPSVHMQMRKSFSGAHIYRVFFIWGQN